MVGPLDGHIVKVVERHFFEFESLIV